MAYQPSDRLCRAISKNFLADFELKEKLASIEKKRKRIGLQLYKANLEIKQQLETCPGRSDSFQTNRTEPHQRNDPDVVILSGCTSPAERKRRNLRSYQRLVRRLQDTSNTYINYHRVLHEESTEQTGNCLRSLKRIPKTNDQTNPTLTPQQKSAKREQGNLPRVPETRLSLNSCPHELMKRHEFPSLHAI